RHGLDSGEPCTPDRVLQNVQRLAAPVVDADVAWVALLAIHFQRAHSRVEEAPAEVQQLIERRAYAEVGRRAGVRRLEELLRREESGLQKRPLPPELLKRHDRLGLAADHRPDMHVGWGLLRIEANLRQL